MLLHWNATKDVTQSSNFRTFVLIIRIQVRMQEIQYSFVKVQKGLIVAAGCWQWAVGGEVRQRSFSDTIKHEWHHPRGVTDVLIIMARVVWWHVWPTWLNKATLGDGIPAKDHVSCLWSRLSQVVSVAIFYDITITCLCLHCFLSMTGRVLSKWHIHLLPEHVKCPELIACIWNNNTHLWLVWWRHDLWI